MGLKNLLAGPESIYPFNPFTLIYDKNKKPSPKLRTKEKGLCTLFTPFKLWHYMAMKPH